MSTEAVVNRYVNTLHLNTLTDYHSPGWLGNFASTIYWTDLVIKCTNLMHWVLGCLHHADAQLRPVHHLLTVHGARHDVSGQPQAGA